jgi:aminopeptidase N
VAFAQPEILLSRAAARLVALGASALLLVVPLGAAAGPALEPGVSLELARWRAQHYSDIRYQLHIVLRSGADRLEGRAEIRVNLRSLQDVVLDWRAAEPSASVGAVSANGRPVGDTRFDSEHLVIPKAALRRGENRISLDFRAPVAVSGAAVTRFVDREDGKEYLHTLFVPSDASTVFPCFDQPDLKARYTLSVAAPSAWRVVSNAPLAATHPGAAQTLHRFARTEPLSTYQFAFAAGPFAELTESPRGNRALPGPVRLYVRQSKLAQAERETPELLALNRDAINWFSAYFGRRFPFAKYDLVLVPELAYGGMEHAGAAFLREESVLFPYEPSANDRLRRAQLLLHETSHQWFGDLVTMRWFDDLWLKEGFANFMAAKATEALLRERLPQVHPWIAFGALKLAAYRTDATRGTTPIWRELDNLASAKSAYGNIVYAKAPGVLRQAEHYVGEHAFRSAVREFLRRHAYGAAQWSDLVRALERASGLRLAEWADTWVKRRGMPRVRAEPVRDRQGRVQEIVLTQQAVLDEPGLWPMKLQLVALAQGRTNVYSVRLQGASARIATPGLGPVELVYPNHGDYGYGQFLLDTASRDYALRHPEALPDDLLRSLVFDSLWESVREAELDPERYIELALAWLPHEADDVSASVMLSRLRVAYLRYLAPARRQALAPRIEAFVMAQMRGAATASRRIAYWRTFLDVARTDAGRALLKDLFAGRADVPGVPLRSRDRFHIVQALLALGEPDAEALLEAQSREDPGSEGRRYAFAAAAARPSPELKLQYFERFLADPSLPESWIEEALQPLNDPDHAPLTLPLLARALQALPRLKRERKIFFINGWLAAFLGGQSSAQALELVQRYLDRETLEPDLRLKVLEAVDPLERVVRIRARFAANGT